MLQKLFKFTNNFFVFGFLIGAIIFLSSFLVAHYSLAVDDNANESRCVNYIGDCDNNQTSCSYFGFDWTSDGYPTGAGNASCCGDDSSEYGLNCKIQSGDNGATCDNNDKVCCDEPNKCVYGGNCYLGGQTLNTSDASTDSEICLAGSGSDPGVWADYDSGIEVPTHPGLTYCDNAGYTWQSSGNCDGAGPNGTCDDSDNNPDNGYCCGDDINENYVSVDCNNNPVSFCCPDNAPYVQNGKCVVSCIYGPVTGLKVTANYYDEVNDRYYIQWDWDNFSNYNPSCTPPNCYVGYHLEDEDGDTFYPCSDKYIYQSNSYLTSVDYNITCMDNCTYQGGDCVHFGANEEHCLRVYPVITDAAGGHQNVGPASSLICINSATCGDNNYDLNDYDDSQSHCDSVSNFQLNGCGDADSSWNLPAGGSASGNCWQGQCCGDDTGEYVKVYSSCGADNASAYSNCTCESDNPFKSCCDEYTDCAGYITGSTVGQCFNFNQVADISESGHQWICKENNTWEDCDTNYNDCGDAVCGSASGVYAGEDGVGMYDNTTTLECCGDDTGEYYAELCPGVTGVERKCCNDSGDRIDQNGHCVSSCPSSNQAPTINLSSPTNGATCQSQSGVRLSWTANDPDGGPNPLQYYVYHSTDQNLVTSHDASVLVATVSSNYYDISGLNYNTTYYWSVIADDGDLQTASEVWSYTTQACDSSQACCQADGCSFIGDGGQPRGYTDSYSCSGDSGCGGSCDIQMTDYYCQDNDESVHQSSGPTGATCDGCEEWDGSDGCNLCTDNECGANHPCTTSQCDLYDPDGIGPVGTQAYYQTRSANCNNCICSAWGAYESCQDSYNNCTGANRVECYQGTGCNTANNACYCETGYDPDGSGGCISDGTYPIVDFDWCLSAQTNTIQFNSTVTGGTEPYTSYSWDFGDNSCSGSNPAPECDDTDPLHTYPAANIYNVTLVVTDSNSLQGQKTEEVDLDAFNKTCSTPFNFNSVVSQSSSSLVLNWDYSLGNSNYAIYRADNGSGTYNQLSNPNYSCDINTCTYTDTGLQAGTQYSYYIVATASNTYNSTTNPVCDGATQAPCPLSAYTKSDVGDLNVYSDSCGKIKIQWNDLGEDYTYRIYRGLDSASTITSSDFLSSLDRTACSNGTCSYEDSSIIPEKIYYYKVTSYSTATGESSLSDADFGSAFSYCYRAPVWGEK